MKVLVIISVLAAVLGAPRPQGSTGGAPTIGSPVWPIRPYSFGYEVHDPATRNFHNRAEIKTATGDVFGSYSVLMPDNYIYTTTFNATALTGYVARLVKTLASAGAATTVVVGG